MHSYAVLCNPGHNRVYFESSDSLMLSELALASAALGNHLRDIEKSFIAGVPYITFGSDEPLSQADVALLSRLSFFYALFEVKELDSGRLLAPIEKAAFEFIDPGISGIMRYQGKTNEVFTRMMINVAALSSPNPAGRLKLLDPVAGKGTTVFEALVVGYDAYGIEIGSKVTAEAVTFLKKYLETEKYKHTLSQEKQSGEKGAFTSLRSRFELAPSKEAIKAGEGRSAEFIAGSAAFADKYYKKNTFDVIVGDLPYGVQHGSVTNEKQSHFTRNPLELLTLCLPAWHTVLKPGGVMVLAWNTFLLPREKLAAHLDKHGFEVFDGPPYDGFCHRVDQAIRRDIIAAKKK